MKALVIGGGGREHAIAWRLRRSPSIEQVYCAPGNAGMALEASCIPAAIAEPDELVALAETLGVAFTVVGPEAPLVAGVADRFHERGLPIVGPLAAAARLEGSKIFAKEFLIEHKIPTAEAVAVSSPAELTAAIDRFGFPVVLKADGLAAGKGVVIAADREEALNLGARMLSGELVGDAGRRLLVERRIEGRELSLILLTDGERIFEFRPTRDHKRAFDNDEGPNTGGMGAFCDDDLLDDDLRATLLDRIVEPTLAGLRQRGIAYRGFLYVGLMIGDAGPQVLEYNVRLGDPETQPLVHRLEGDFGELLRSAAAGSLDDGSVAWRNGVSTCVVMASGGYPGPYECGFPVSGLARAEERGATAFHAGTLFRAGRVVTSGGRVLGVTASGADRAAAVEAAYAAVAEIDFQGARFRRDIGRASTG